MLLVEFCWNHGHNGAQWHARTNHTLDKIYVMVANTGEISKHQLKEQVSRDTTLLFQINPGSTELDIRPSKYFSQSTTTTTLPNLACLPGHT